jgi:phosphoinositide-3-kinase regulatory subunit 4
MGNASYRQTTGNQYLTQDLRNYFQNDLPKFILQSKIGNGKFMKTYIMRVDSTPIVVKVYMKLNDEDLQIPSKNLAFIWRILTPIKYPNLLPYQLWLKSSSRIKSNASPVYLIRQFFNTNLYDRLSTRPFLNEIEKLFIVYQLLKCLEICHEHDIVHGDIKPENLMCTTSNWLILTDFSPFKPTMIPDDDPTDFQYYFDSMSRHRCYVAPERFYRKEVKSRWGGKEGFSQSNDNDSDDSDFLTETNGKISSLCFVFLF